MIEVNPTDRLVFDLRMHQIDYNEEKKNSLRREIANKYNVPIKNVEVNFVPVTVDDKGESISLATDIINNIQNASFQQSLFGEYLQQKEIKDVDIEEIKAIDAQVNAFVDFDSYSKYKTYKFKYVKWSNYLSYGKDNYFDFTKLNGLVLLNGQPENQCGKTTFAIDLLRFALFGKAQKSPTLDSVFNIYLPEATEVMVEAGLEINDVDYVIRRTVTRPALSKRTKKSKAKQKLEYFKVVGNEFVEIDNCEGENTAETNNIIKESIGNVEDFNLVISATAYTLGDLLRIGQSDKGRLFSRWLGLLSIEKKEEIAKSLWKKNISPKLLSNTYDIETLKEENNNYNVCIEENDKTIADYEKKQKEAEKNIDKQNKEKVKVLSKRKEIKEELSKIDITTLENNISAKNEELSAKRGNMRSLKEQYTVVKDANYNEDKANELKQSVENLKNDINVLNINNAELKVKINSFKSENQRIQTLIDGKKCPTCGQMIDATEQNHNIDKNNKEIDLLINEGVANKKKIEEINAEIVKITTEINKEEEEKEKLRRKNELELKMSAVKTNIDNIKLILGNLLQQKDDVEVNKDNIKFNNDIERKIEVIDESLAVEQQIKENTIRDIQSLKSENKKYQEEIEKRDVIIKKLNEEAKIIRNWSIYQELVGKNGIIKIVLKRALPILNNEIARLLNGLCDFNVEISISEDNKVCMDLVRGGQRLDLGTCASGFETVMASMAIRHSLASIATMAKANFTVYDEILDGVAVSNYDNVKELFNRMTKSYDFIIHITHNELISDWHNNIITVTKSDNGISVIEMK